MSALPDVEYEIITEPEVSKYQDLSEIVVYQAEALAEDKPELCEGYYIDKAPMLPTFDLVSMIAPMQREHVAFCSLTQTRAYGNGYVVFDLKRGMWIRNTNISQQYHPSMSTIGRTVRMAEKSRAATAQGQLIIARLLRSVQQMEKASGSWMGVLTAAKPLLERDEEWAYAQAFSWLLSRERETTLMSDLHRAHDRAKHVGGVDWPAHIAPELELMGLVVHTGNRPRLHLGKDSVRDALEEYVSASG